MLRCIAKGDTVPTSRLEKIRDHNYFSFGTVQYVYLFIYFFIFIQSNAHKNNVWMHKNNVYDVLFIKVCKWLLDLDPVQIIIAIV